MPANGDELKYIPARFLQFRRGSDPDCEHRRVTLSPSSSTWFVQKRVICLDCQAMAGYVAGSMNNVTEDTPDISRWNPDTETVDPPESGYQRTAVEEQRAVMSWAHRTWIEWHQIRFDYPELVPELVRRRMTMVPMPERFERLVERDEAELARRMRRLHGEIQDGSGNRHHTLWFDGSD